VVAQMQNMYISQGKTGPEFHAYSRPPEVEGEAANRAIMIADMAGCPLYIVHTSSKPAHEAIMRARAEGKRVFGEPLIQHLVLDETDYLNKSWDHAAQRVMSPPFRPKHHQDSLWAGLQAGSLQVVATDHCSFTTEQKRIGLNDFRNIPNGTGGLEDRMPVLWTTGVNSGRLTPNEFVAVTSANSARILNIYPQKGVIMPGSDADIVIWDPKATKTISAKSQVSRIEYNVFEGYELTGLPEKVYLRGRLAAENGQVRAERGEGRFVPRRPLPAFAEAQRLWKTNTAPKAVAR
jgi:dihydropyrimidinase